MDDSLMRWKKSVVWQNQDGQDCISWIHHKQNMVWLVQERQSMTLCPVFQSWETGLDCWSSTTKAIQWTREASDNIKITAFSSLSCKCWEKQSFIIQHSLQHAPPVKAAMHCVCNIHDRGPYNSGLKCVLCHSSLANSYVGCCWRPVSQIFGKIKGTDGKFEMKVEVGGVNRLGAPGTSKVFKYN